MRPLGQILTQYGGYNWAPQKKGGMKSQGEDGTELEGGSCKPTTLRTAGMHPKPEEARKDSLPELSARTSAGACFQTSSLQNREARHFCWS